MTVAIISSIYGDYDTPSIPVPQTVDCDWILVTDRPHNSGWIEIVEPRAHMHPRMAAKVAKCRPDLYSDAEFLIWIDGSFVIGDPSFAEWCVDRLGNNDIAQFTHPQRRSILGEADVSAGMEKYATQPVQQQARFYVDQGHPDDWGLWASGICVRRNYWRPAEYGDAWLREQARWTYQDQISQPYVLRQLGLAIGTLTGGTIWSHPLFHIRHHAHNL